ncbi:MAG: hypothetical protein ACNA7T_10325 [Haliea sp.]
MSTKATQITDAVLALLEGITPANDYNTDAGLRTERSYLDIDPDDSEFYPAILIRTTGDPVEQARPNPAQARRSRTITCEGYVWAGGDDYEPDMDDLAEDMLRALLPATSKDALNGLAIDVSLTGADYEHPAEGSNVAVVRYTVTASYAVSY